MNYELVNGEEILLDKVRQTINQSIHDTLLCLQGRPEIKERLTELQMPA
jgi:hypothetical protein